MNDDILRRIGKASALFVLQRDGGGPMLRAVLIERAEQVTVAELPAALDLLSQHEAASGELGEAR
jgi:hypothetical protein